ncbi:hypothetical protein Pcinc_040277 [Petrolisthes cinctipes]|uniref:Uncharacterized protein n=1 Tax=Petrolisthes cinctipes TaxID=88211 RepID=A0AAE1EIS3_PETCI|nr:hypothetical protein Pcinc_040277 [Petrolisthes cinctipes]
MLPFSSTSRPSPPPFRLPSPSTSTSLPRPPPFPLHLPSHSASLPPPPPFPLRLPSLPLPSPCPNAHKLPPRAVDSGTHKTDVFFGWLRLGLV